MKKIYAGLLGLTLTSALALSANAADYYRGGLKDGPPPPPPPPAYVQVNWSGFYVGFNGGYGWTSNSGPYDLSPSGGFGGGQVGYNWQGAFGFGGSWVLGIETDIQGAGISDSVSVPGAYAENSLNWFGTVRGRVGYAFGPTLVYFTGGFAFGEVESKGAVAGLGAWNVTDTQTGYVLGGGLEYRFNPAWSVKGEYQFISLDANTNAGPLSGNYYNTDRSEIDTIRIGLNYHIGQGPLYESHHHPAGGREAAPACRFSLCFGTRTLGRAFVSCWFSRPGGSGKVPSKANAVAACRPLRRRQPRSHP